jgi:hypothetical protein
MAGPYGEKVFVLYHEPILNDDLERKKVYEFKKKNLRLQR